MREPAITEQRNTTALNNAAKGQCVAKRSLYQLVAKCWKSLEKKLMETWRLSITAGLRPFDKSIDGS